MSMSLKIKKICWSVTLFLILNPVISIAALVLYLVHSNSYTVGEIGWITFFGLVFAVSVLINVNLI